MKYLIRDGEEWNGEIPSKSISFEEILFLTSSKKSEFSLVINQMQKKREANGNHYFPKIFKFARQLQKELKSHTVSCNLYLTPMNSSRAFETHMDWMDVIVVQILGKKEWSIYNKNPLYYLGTPNLKRKPTKKELQQQYRNKNINNIVMQPGDALYIPRGYMHNATTLPSPSSSKHPLSLHLTFGIEHLYDTTMEALLHYSLNLFVQEESSSLPTSLAHSVALSPESCNGKSSMTYSQFLHYSISEVIQWTNCGGFGEEESGGRLKERQSQPKSEKNDEICFFRRSIPLHPYMTKNIKEYSDSEIEKQYIKSLYAVTQRINIQNTLQFIYNYNTMQSSSTGKLMGTQAYSFPGMTSNMYKCKPKSSQHLLSSSTPITLSTNQINFVKFIHEFHIYAKATFQKSKQLLMKYENNFINENWS